MSRTEPVTRANQTAEASRRARRPWVRIGATLSLCIGLVACSGGSGGGDGSSGNPGDPVVNPPTSLGVLKVTVKDSYGATVAGAKVKGVLGESSKSGTTDAKGVALLLIDWPDGTADVTVARETFIEKNVDAPIVKGKANEVSVTLDRATTAAGGSFTSRGSVLPTVDGDTQRLSFEIELVVVGGDAQPVSNLSASDFTLRACVPVTGNTRSECLRGSDGSADLAYTPVNAAPEALQRIPGGTTRAYGAALLLDQSGSILRTDVTGARLYSAKAFLGGLGTSDRALLGAFADGSDALIPTRPLTAYPPSKDRATASSYYPTLDALADLAGGETPLYDSIDAMRDSLLADRSIPSDLAKAVVVFTDGDDTTCGDEQGCAAARASTIARAKAEQVRIFTIGLSSSVDISALGELANQTGGALLYADSAEQLLPLYGSVGKLLSLSLPTYRLRWTVQATAPGAFQPGQSLLGKVRVTAGTSTFDVPFVVGIP